MTVRTLNEAGLRANDPVDRIDLPVEMIGGDLLADPFPTPSRPRSEGAEMAPEIDAVDSETA